MDDASSPPPSSHFGQERSWQGLRSTLIFAGLLLGTSVASIVALRWAHAKAPEVELAQTLFDAVLVFLYALHDRALLKPLLGDVRFREALRGWLVAAVVMTCLALAYFPLLTAIGFETVRVTDPFVARHWPLWSVYLLLTFAPAVVEELAFRGIVQGRLAEALSERDAWLIQAALFAVAHLSPVIFPSHFVIGLVLGWMRRRTGSLYPGMVAHGLYNAVLVFSELG